MCKITCNFVEIINKRVLDIPARVRKSLALKILVSAAD